MPKRSKLVGKLDLEIANRMRQVRVELKLSQQETARILEFTRNRLAAIEYGYTPLRLGMALEFCSTFKINAAWLASGTEPKEGFISPHGSKWENDWWGELSRDEPLSDVWSNSRHLFDSSIEAIEPPEEEAKLIERIRSNARPGTPATEAVINNTISQLLWLRFPSQAGEIEFTRRAKDCLSELICTWLNSNRAFLRTETRRRALRQLRSEASQSESSSLKTSACQSSQIGNSRDMPSDGVDLPSLLESVRKLTSKRGKKKELAARLGVPASRVTEWLSGVREPGGAVTLRLLDWVKSQNAQPEK